MFCPYCGASGLGSDGICQACGQQVRTSSVELELTPANEETGDSCPNCGSPLGADENFCGQCGTRVSLAPSDEPSATDIAGAWAGAAPKPSSRLLSSGPRQQSLGWNDEATEDYNAPTESLRRTSYPHAPFRNVSGSSPLDKIGGQRATAGLRMTGKPPVSPSRSQAALLISLLCFLASFLSGAAAIWLAVAR
jgi:DNA-directed RNA polymerase subunit RPC12/RpoP